MATRDIVRTPVAHRPARRRDALLARLLAAPLDARLARGVPPQYGRLLAARADQLVGPHARDELADAWELVLERADLPRRGGDPRVPVARSDVRDAAPEISALIGALRGHGALTARQVARARVLLTDGAGPVYRPGRGLRQAVVAVLDALAG